MYGSSAVRLRLPPRARHLQQTPPPPRNSPFVRRGVKPRLRIDLLRSLPSSPASAPHAPAPASPTSAPPAPPSRRHRPPPHRCPLRAHVLRATTSTGARRRPRRVRCRRGTTRVGRCRRGSAKLARRLSANRGVEDGSRREDPTHTSCGAFEPARVRCSAAILCVRWYMPTSAGGGFRSEWVGKEAEISTPAATYRASAGARVRASAMPRRRGRVRKGSRGKFLRLLRKRQDGVRSLRIRGERAELLGGSTSAGLDEGTENRWADATALMLQKKAIEDLTRALPLLLITRRLIRVPATARHSVLPPRPSAPEFRPPHSSWKRICDAPVEACTYRYPQTSSSACSPLPPATRAASTTACARMLLPLPPAGYGKIDAD
ncbi:hypothetical protein DFH09DRAFT_1097615 [Mycena vulgaris]|nr:hypothetical protein DFH09DRAFT_1097615 [Mycena vulgaris]